MGFFEFADGDHNCPVNPFIHLIHQKGQGKIKLYYRRNRHKTFVKVYITLSLHSARGFYCLDMCPEADKSKQEPGDPLAYCHLLKNL